MLEIRVEEHLVRVCKRRGARCEKTEPIAKGFPDRGVFAPGGRLCLVELKRIGDQALRPAQRVWRKILRGLGFQVERLYTKEAIDAWAENFFDAD